jgi:hypothetical protein
MSITQKTIYQCDICGKETELRGEIIRQTVPYVGDGDSRSVASREVDMCEDCRMKFREVIWNYFVETGDYGIIVKKKF